VFKELKRRQMLLGLGVLSLLGTGAGLILWVTFASEDRPKPVPSSVVLGSDRLDPKEIWVHQIQSDHKILNQKVEVLEGFMKTILSRVESLSMAPPSVPAVGETVSKGPENRSNASTPQPVSEPRSAVSSSFEPFPLASDPHSASSSSRSGIVKISLKSLPKKPLKTVDTHVPSGSFARGVLLGGVDASTSIQASSEPRPVLLKIVDLGTLPRSFRSDLKDCHAIGAAYGDLASERVYIRLEKISAVERLSGEVVEIPVKGYVAGEDGKTGMKGILRDRSTESMRNALMGGFLSGIGDFFSQAKNPVTFTPVAPFGQAQALAGTQMLKDGASKGLANAFEKYADFYIKRAEQMQPVLEVEAGRILDIVITEGFEMSDSLYRKRMSAQRDTVRTERVESLRLPPSSESPSEEAA
jgi:conjugal transfer pilus assembly protein TraB